MKVDESIEDRKFIKEKIEKSLYYKLPTPEKVKIFEENIT